MSRSYVVQPGDTFDTVARRQYGDDQKAPLIRNANPGASEPLTPGETLVVPNDPAALPSASANAAASSPNEVAVSIEGDRFRFWESVTITRSLDAVSTAEFVAPFEPDGPAFRERFRPFSYKNADIDVGGQRLFTGILVSPVPSFTPTARIVTASCYGRAGVLGDCTAPASAYPLEWDGVTITTIAQKLASLFGLSASIEGDPGAVFERVALEPNTRVLQFLADLAAQRGLLLADLPSGDLLLRTATQNGAPVADLTQGDAGPLFQVDPLFSPQEYYSHITGIAPVVIGLAGTQYTVKNARLATAVRPFAFGAQDTTDNAVQKAVETKAGRMFANAVTYQVQLDTWRDRNGNLWEPNTLVTLLAPGAMVYSRYTFLVRSVTLTKTNNTETATLDLVLPGAFAGQQPETMPWD